jgi:hypothetical protein
MAVSKAALALSTLTVAALATGCTAWLFSGIPYPSHENPVMRIETRGGTELGAGTDVGVLFLARTAQEGPCRVHYWRGPTPLVEDGVVERWGGIFYRATIDLKHPFARFLDRELRADDKLKALLYARGAVEVIELKRATDPAIAGDVVVWPGRDLPVGTGVFSEDERGLLFVGLIAGQIEVAGTRYLVHTGVNALREAMMTAKPHAERRQVKHRPDDITIDRTVPR